MENEWAKALATATGPLKTRSGKKVLPLHPPEIRFRRSVRRDIRLVHEDLQALFGELVQGRLPWPLLLWGPVGTGKTLAALSLADMLRFPTYHTVEDCCQGLLGKTLLGPVWDWSRTPDLAILDELAMRKQASELEASAVKIFCDWRDFKCEGVALYVSNLGPQGIQEVYDDRIASRVSCGTVFKLDGPDRRMEPPKGARDDDNSS